MFSTGVLSEPPEPFAVPLPGECSLPHSGAHSYNQGQCSRRPCRTDSGPCSLLWRCCYEVGQVSTLPFTCSNSARALLGTVIATCECQPCDKLHASIRGRVLSSRGGHPVVLAAVMLGDEIVAFTEESGRFFFELATVEGDIRLLVQEVRHRPVWVGVDLRTSLSPDIAVTLEYTEHVVMVDKLHEGFKTDLGDMATSEVTGIEASVSMPPKALLSPEGYEVYQGPGHLLHSLYHMDSRPDFTSAAIQTMVYRDSKGVDFSIQAHVAGSMRVVGETGHALQLRQGSYASLSVGVRFDGVMDEGQVSGLHLFTYPDLGPGRWLDNGKVVIDEVRQSRYSTWVELHTRLRDSNLLWAVGFPSRVTCYIKSRVYHFVTRREVADVTVQLEQSVINLDRPSFYMAAARSVPGEGVCLKGVCGLGGLLYVKDTVVGEEVHVVAHSPSTRHGVIMGNGDQVLIYNVDKSLVTDDDSTPYYPSEEACLASVPRPQHHGNESTGHFEFYVNISATKHLRKDLSIFPPLAAEGEESAPGAGGQGETCYIKVGVYDCSSQDISIQALSYSSTNHTHLLSMASETLPNDDREVRLDTESCVDADLVHLRTVCLKYVCGADVHVSAQAWSPLRGERSSSRGGEGEGGCRYWSSHSSLTTRMHLRDSMTSFHLWDKGPDSEGVSEGGLGGLYHADSEETASLQCQAAGAEVSKTPPATMNHSNVLAVTFICY